MNTVNDFERPVVSAHDLLHEGKIRRDCLSRRFVCRIQTHFPLLSSASVALDEKIAHYVPS